MDLQRFSPGNAGCIRELHELIAVVPLHRVILMVDATTDQSFLQRTLEESWHTMTPASPNRATSLSDVRLLPLGSLGGRELREPLRRLCGAVAGAR